MKVTGTPLVECPVTDQFGGQQPTDSNQTGDEKSDADAKVDGDASDTTGLKQVKVGDRTLCEDTTVDSNTDWSGYREDPPRPAWPSAASCCPSSPSAVSA